MAGMKDKIDEQRNLITELQAMLLIKADDLEREGKLGSAERFRRQEAELDEVITSLNRFQAIRDAISATLM